ncbi:MAG: leucine-rich repeat protein [Bacilli bacterium]|nr:leucine-rich repeat protein [Bacilli bacterium]
MDRNGNELTSLRIAKDLKYTALYWALGFEEFKEGIFVKGYEGASIVISCKKGEALIEGPAVINGECLKLNDGDSFVVLELIDRLLTIGVPAVSIILDLDNDFDVYVGRACFKCVDYDAKAIPAIPRGKFDAILYRSRLYSGVIERKVNANGFSVNMECFEGALSFYGEVYPSFVKDGFVVSEGKAIAYEGHGPLASVPEGVVSLDSGLFWDNQEVVEVKLPESLEDLGGDTFYNCANLERVTIPENVTKMGNNPFAGCPKLTLINRSKRFETVDGALYDPKERRLIHFPINSPLTEFAPLEGTRIIGKHAFYMCEGLRKVHLPKSLIHMENFPFSGCFNLALSGDSPAYQIDGGVVYNRYGTELIGVLPSIDADRLILRDGLRTICRNSFYRCKGIKSLVLPKTLTKIGYNPFVGCDITFESESPFFRVQDGLLLSEDGGKLICCPPSKAVGEFKIPESVIELERGAFSGCDKMTSIVLKNVSKIGKSCFTNCSSLRNIHLSDFVSYVGEWAFAHCASLKEISVYKGTVLDRNVTLNSPCKIAYRTSRSDYIVESDNLPSLKGLQLTLKGKVDSIVIDPPYNTKIGYIGYQDDFGGSYLDFIAGRLKLAKPLLSDRGWLVMNIDSGEHDSLLKLCRTIFGSKNVFSRIWKTSNPKFDKNRALNTAKANPSGHEFIIFARKDRSASLGQVKSPEGTLIDMPRAFDGYGTNSSAKDELALDLGNRGLFQTPKPVKLIQELIRATSQKDSIVLDFFAGSGTAGKAVKALNEEDGGDRRYILVTNSEADICNRVTRKRLQGDGHFDL